MSTKLDQHTVSRFYLKLFAAPEGDAVLWQFSKHAPDSKPKRISPRKATAEERFYSIQGSDGSWNDSIEDALGVVETAAAGPIKSLAAGQLVGSSASQDIAYFMGLMFLRGRLYRDHCEAETSRIQSDEGTLRWVEKNRERFERKYPKKDVDDFVREVRERGFGVQMPSKFYFYNIFERAVPFAKMILRMHWRVERATKGAFFVTSDNPVYVRRPVNPLDPGFVGIERSDLNAELGFPLSRDAFLLGTWRNDRPERVKATPTRVRELNRRTIVTAYNHVYAPFSSEEIAALVTKHADDGVRYAHLLR